MTKIERPARHILENWHHIRPVFCSILFSVFFALLIFPVLINLEFVKDILGGTARHPFMAVTALILLVIVYSWTGAQNLWEKYKNTHKLEKPPFTYLDHIVIFVVFSAFLITLFRREFVGNLSSEFSVFAVFNSVCILGWFLSSYFWKKKKEEKRVSNIDIHSLSDEPIQFMEQDLLGREKFIEGLEREITELPFSDSFVFGLYGSWGEGKTSIMNLLRNKLEENEKLISMNFDPWYFKDEEAILNAFHKQVEHALSQKFLLPDLKKTLTRYQRLISTGLSQAGIKLDFSYEGESPEETRQRIGSYITLTGTRIIIFVDDIDRLQPKEILLVFKLIRLNARFLNTIFFLSFDPIIVEKYLKEALDADPEFLGKIVQKPVPLPAIEEGHIDRFLDVKINELLDEIDISGEDRIGFKTDFTDIYQTQIRKLFRTLRHIKRYINGLRSTLPAIKNEINLYDFCILEVIRIFYPRVFDDIWWHPWFYIPPEWSDTLLFRSPFGISTEEDKKYPQIKKHIEELTEDEKEKEALIELLESIFFVVVKNAFDQTRTSHDGLALRYRSEKRITHPESFRKYFLLQVPLSEIPDEFVETTLNSWHSAKKTEREVIIETTIFRLQKGEMLMGFLRKVIVFSDRINREVAHNIVRVVYMNAGKFSKKGREDWLNCEYDQAKWVLLSLINDKMGEDEIPGALGEVITETPNLLLAVEIVLYCQPERGASYLNIRGSVNAKELQNIVTARLEDYFVRERRDIFDELPEEKDWDFVLRQWATNWGTFEGDSRRTVSEYLVSLVKDDVKKFTKFLAHHKQRTVPNGWTFNLDEIGRIYDLTQLEDLAKKFKNVSALSRDERDLIEKFLRLCAQRNRKNGEG